MTRTIVIAYSTQSGHTLRLAEAIADGMKKVGSCTIILQDVADLPDGGSAEWTALHKSDAIIFGTPTYMGGVSAGFKTFMDASSDFWQDQTWTNKVAAGFTVGSRHSGDKLLTLQHLSIFAAQHGMIWIGQATLGDRAALGCERGPNGDGSWLGLMATSSTDKTQMIPPADLDTAVAFGERIAKAVYRWNGETKWNG